VLKIFSFRSLAITTHFADRLFLASQNKAPVCVGIDPVFEKMPAKLRDQTDPNCAAEVIALFEEFTINVLQAAANHAACVKFQSACFERYHHLGVDLLQRMLKLANEMGLITINDAKRGDIGISAAHYGAGCLGRTHYSDLGTHPGADSLTCNAYLGEDSLQPLLDVAAKEGKGLFALVRTSNPGGDTIQNLVLAEGHTVCQAVATMIAELGEQSIGDCGYSHLGAVVGATQPDQAVNLRVLMPRQIFLVPGFGAQGGGPEDVKACFNDDHFGAIITASRSVIYAYQTDPNKNWAQAIDDAAEDLSQQIQSILKG